MPDRSRPRSRLSALGFHWWDAVSGGRFFSGWTLVASLVISVAVLSPYAGLQGVGEHVAAMAVSLISWGLLVLVLLPVALTERHLVSRRRRAVLVVLVLLAYAVARPFLNDGLAVLLVGHESTGSWAQRIATNILCWSTVLPLVAVAGARYADAHEASVRLARAVSAFDDVRRRVAQYAQHNAALLTVTIADVRRRRDHLLSGRVDFDAVRTFADEVRSASHRLDERLGARLRTDDDPGPPTVPQPPVPTLARIGRPSPGLVTILYAAASTPYVLTVGGLASVTLSTVVIVVLAVAADLLVRAVARRGSAVLRGTVVLVAWCGVGAGVSAAAFLLADVRGVVALIPVLTIPALAIVVGVAADAIHRARQTTGSLTELLTRTAVLATAQTAHAREPLWRAVDLLHDRIQSRCVIFAARVDDRAPTPEEVERFRAETDAALDDILQGTVARDEADLDGVLATWSGILDIQAEIDPAAVAALESRAVAASVIAVVSEGFVNAVKHSGASAARLRISSADDETAVTVTVASTGTLRDSDRGGLGLAAFGDRAELRQEGAEVVLEVTVPVASDAGAPTGSERRWRPPTTTVRLP